MWKVLVVDDEIVNQKLLVEILKGKAECDVAGDGKEALDAYSRSLTEEKPYDVILLDISMPEVDGVEVVKRIRRHEEELGVLLGDGVPIIMVTAHKEQFLKAFNEGCDDYVVKPINALNLLQKMEHYPKPKRI